LLDYDIVHFESAYMVITSETGYQYFRG